MPSWHAGTTGAVEDLFIPAKTYEGSRPGYRATTAPSAAAAQARGNGGGVERSWPRRRAEITELDAASLKRLLLSLEKKITRNQQLRVKYGDDPSRFAESEVDLDDALQQMGLCAAAPELYGSLCDLGGVASIVGLLSHENADISASACSLLYDLTDADVVDSSEAGAAGAATLAAAIEAAQGLEVLASNVARFDEAVTEEAEAVHNTLGVFENVLDVGGPGAAEAVAAKTCLGPWLLARAGVKGFGPIKLYASEILSILAGAFEAAAGALAEAEVGGADGVDALLTACAYYRKRAPAVGDEEECVENLFQALGSLVSSAPATTLPRLVRSEGVELLVKCAKEGKHAAACALRVLAGALEWGNLGDDGDANPLPPFFACGGLKVLFPALRGRGAALRRDLAPTPPFLRRRRTMSSFHGNSGQDWSTVNVGRSAKPFKKPTDADKKQDLTKALRTGGVATSERMGGATNKTVAGHGIMGTTAGAGARKIEEETETFKVQKTGLAFGKALMQARTAKKMSQKDLGTKINEKPQVIQQYEGGKAVPNPQVISKIERALGVKLPRPPKVQKVKD
ncbi:DNA binding protein [Aureococcus anophagefferens]|nr:DNA binding protein [Aureococcus anophagefferens]